MTSKVVLQPSLFQKFRKLRREIDAKGSATIQDLLNIGKAYAQSYVPKDTQFTMRSIKTRLFKRKTPTGKIYIEPYLTKDGHRRNLSKFSLVKWMHTSAKADGHFKTGNPKFLYNTRKYLNTIKKRTATGRFKTINIK